MATVLTAFEVAIAIGTIVKALYDFADSSKGASHEIRKLVQELYGLKGALEHLELRRQEEGFDGAVKSQVEEMLRMIKETLDVIGAKLDGSRRALIKQAITWPFKSSEVQKHLDTIERAKTWLIMVLMKDTSNTTLAIYDELKKLATALHEDMVRKQTGTMMKETAGLLQWLAPFNTDEMLAKANETKMPGTGQWILDAAFARWADPEECTHPFMWISGSSGSGKTTLFSTIVEHMRELCEATGPRDRIFGYHCCSLENASSQRIPNIFGSVFAGVGRSHPDTLQYVRPFRTSSIALVPQNTLDGNAINTIISALLSEFRCLYILVDALNETSERPQLIRALFDLCESFPRVRVLVTSTSEPSKTSPHLTIRRMKTESIDLDIELYVKHRLNSEPSFESLSPKVHDRIVEKIVHDAHGMFRWAKLGLDRLSSLRTGRDVLDALTDMPTTLNDSYVGILDRITDHDRPLAREALLWLTFSLQPLVLRELAEAVVLRETDSFIDDDYRLTNPGSLLEILQGLAVSKRRPGLHVVVLAHDSIRSFLTSDIIRSTPAAYFALSAAEAHSKMMRKCLTYLRLNAFASGPVYDRDKFQERKRAHPLLDYATFLWPIHTEQFRLSPSDEKVILDFFATKGSRTASFESWVQFLLEGDGNLVTIQQTEPLYYAASFNMISVLKILLRPELRIDVNRPGGRYSSPPLFVALWRRNREAAAMLLRAGADPDARDYGTGVSCRNLAESRGFREIVDLMGNVARGRFEEDEGELGGLPHSRGFWDWNVVYRTASSRKAQRGEREGPT